MNAFAPDGDAGRESLKALELVHHQPVTQPIDHGSGCCTTARMWLAARHAAGAPTTALSGLAWIAESYPWGPSQWPMSWCRLVEQEKLDCGAHSAIAREVIRGAGEVLGVQLLIRAGRTDIAHWGCTWRDQGVAATWLFDDLYYHETIAIGDTTLVVFDPTRNWRVSPDGGTEPESVVAIRVSGAGGRTLRWGQNELAMGRWALLAQQHRDTAGAQTD